jgi:tRNA (guanine37-N1)-methyltransferase
MRIDIITALPDLLKSPFETSILKKSIDLKLIDLHIHNLRDFTKDNYKTIDDNQFGGGAGMVMNIQPIYNCINNLKIKRKYDEVIYLTPDGEKLNQGLCNSLSLNQNIILLCGHYKGVDHRIREHLITKEVSIGDYVITGGELAACILSDAIVRLIPGVISDETSALYDSFQDNMLPPPIYTRPSDFNGWKVPEVLLSGNQSEIEKWRDKKALERTNKLRPDLLEKNID